MNKLKQAIAYLASKIQTAYYAAKFLAAIVLQEIPYGYHTTAHKDIRGTGCRTDNESTNRGVEADGDRSAESIRGQETVGNTAPAYDEFIGFWAGDPRDRFYDQNYQRSGSPQKCGDEDLRHEPRIQQSLQKGGDWDLLEPCDRQAIVLNKMREHQSKLDEYCIFSTHDVMQLCDRPDLQWSLMFDDLMTLDKKSLVQINIVDCDRTKKFYGFFWGLK